MEQLFNNFPAKNLDDNFNPIILDTIGVQGLSEESSNQKVDISKASIEELSSIVVTDMIDSVREDLASIRITSQK